METSLELKLRTVDLYCKSSIIPKIYQGEENKGNCLIALDMAERMNCNPLMVMQNLYIVQGKPAWSAAFLIATINSCGKFTPLQYELVNDENLGVKCRCYAWYKDEPERTEKNCLRGSWVSWDMVTKEGWNAKTGSKWNTMPEQMFRYRAAAFWQRTYCPEIGMGFLTADELTESRPIQDVECQDVTNEVDEFDKMNDK